MNENLNQSQSIREECAAYRACLCENLDPNPAPGGLSHGRRQSVAARSTARLQLRSPVNLRLAMLARITDGTVFLPAHDSLQLRQVLSKMNHLAFD
jgi:hypothetical protein